METERSLDLLDQLRTAEHDLLRQHYVRLRVNKVTADGRNAMCVACQVQSRFLRQDLKAEEIVAACQAALSTLHRVGLNPLIGTVPRQTFAGLEEPDPNDPFLLRSALSAAGFGEMLLTPGPGVGD